jgi:hypothetical protein
MTKTQLLRPVAAAGAGLALAVGGIVVATSPASADTPGCVTKKEYRKIHKGMTKKRVHRIFDTRGWFADGGAGGYSRAYLSCDHRHEADIEYSTLQGKPARTDGWKRWRLYSCRCL